ncbi:MAG: serine/threonine-protein kinase, partial [Bryobacterales bacterium]|nr:serine/threonine-protein kinase [Bryobacterales bacterium]
RTVVIRILRDETTSDPDREISFIEEAKAASALNHPHIASIYDIDRTDDVHFIAMEYVRGKSLDKAIPRKGLPLEEALKYGMQMTDALASAHSAGILHRELKPENVMISESGLAKVLDFGLAKLTEQVGVSPSSREATAETDTSRLRIGSSGNHAAYISPEQAQGKPADHRSDIFSFGVLLYEMLAGKPAFLGQTPEDAVDAVINTQPKPLREIVEGLPLEVERVVNRCLRKDPNRRFQLMEDLKLTLEELREELDSHTLTLAPPPPVRPGSHRTRKPFLVAALILAAAAAYPGWKILKRFVRPAAPQFKLIQLTRDSGVTETPALSPDGKLVAYASDRENGENLDLWVQHVDGGGAVRLTTHPAGDHSPAFSPDGTQIAFYSERDGGGVYLMPALGGEPRLIAKGGRLPRFSPDGRQIAYYISPQGGITGARMFVVSADGSSTTQLQKDFDAAAVPVWTPQGDGLLFFGTHPTDGGDVWMAPLAGGKPIKTGAGPIVQRQGVEIKTLDALNRDGDYLYFTGSLGDSTNIWRIALSPRSWQAIGPAERLTSGTAELHASLARSGRVVFTAAARTSRLYTIPIDPTGAVQGELTGFTAGGAQDTSCDISEDGGTVVFRSNKSGTIDIWIREVKTGVERPLTSSPESESMPRISADATRVAFSVIRNQKRVVFVVPVSGGAAEELCADCGPPAGWSRDGKQIFYTLVRNYRPEVHVFDLATRKSSPVLVHDKLPLYGGRVAPGNRWVSFKEDFDVARTAIFVAPLHVGAPTPVSEWVHVTEGRSWDDLPRWSPDGNLIFFTSDRDGFRCIWARRLHPQTKQPQGEPFAIAHLHKMQLSMSNLSLAEFELASGLGRLVFPMAELRGNVWLMEPGDYVTAR